MNTNPRDIALDTILAIMKDGMFCDRALHASLSKVQYLPKRDRAFITCLVQGCVERAVELDYSIDLISTVPVEKMKPVICNILRMGLYQIRYMKVPAAAAINESVRLAQSRGFYSLKGFVNGVLRNLVRAGDNIPLPDRETEPVRYLSVTGSCPDDLTEMFMNRYGFETTEKILQSFLKPRRTCVRLREREVDIETILASLSGQGVSAAPSPYLPYAYYLSDYNYLPALDAFMRGWIFPQDVSSMLVAEAAGIQGGEQVLDLCAAPGGKSLHIAEKLGGTGNVTSRDLTGDKVALIRENIARSGLTNIHAEQADALDFDGASEGRMDVVICDLPCSGLGVIGHKPDIKYHATKEGIEELADLQRRILHNAASYVRPGGVLIYSTCTISKEENEDNASWFCDTYPFHAESLESFMPEALKGDVSREGYLQLLPGVHESDGFFIARMRRDTD